ncbi:MAG: hypothetical protein OK474_02185 [Thaumarchaeota archaeon]|nr:hypothetical protein [Nitrososphaerota archaeon]
MSSQDALSRMEAMLQEHERRIKTLEQKLGGGGGKEETVVQQQQQQQQPVSLTPKVISIRAFILEKSPTDDVQRSLVIGYYLEKQSGLSSFNAKDLERGFVDAREKVPGNVADKILKNVWKGHMMQVSEDKDGLKAYVLTNTGTKFVESGISK